LEHHRSRCRPIPIIGPTIFISQTELYFTIPLSPCALESCYLHSGIFGNFSEFIENPAKPVSPGIGETLRDF